MGQTVKEAVDARRLHHQLVPMEIKYEDGVTKVTVEEISLDFIFVCSGWLMVYQSLATR